MQNKLPAFLCPLFIPGTCWPAHTVIWPPVGCTTPLGFPGSELALVPGCRLLEAMQMKATIALFPLWPYTKLSHTGVDRGRAERSGYGYRVPKPVKQGLLRLLFLAHG